MSGPTGPRALKMNGLSKEKKRREKIKNQGSPAKD